MEVYNSEVKYNNEDIKRRKNKKCTIYNGLYYIRTNISVQYCVNNASFGKS